MSKVEICTRCILQSCCITPHPPTPKQPSPPHTCTPTRDASAVNAPTMHNHTALATPPYMIKNTPSGVALPPPTANCGKVRFPTGRAERSETEKLRMPCAARATPHGAVTIFHTVATLNGWPVPHLCFFSPPSFCCH